MTIIKQQDILRLIYDNPKARFDFRFFSVLAEQGIRPTDTTSGKTYLPAGNLSAYLEDEKGKVIGKTPIQRLIPELWESLAFFSMDGKCVCKRSAYGKPMLSNDDSFFKQSRFAQRIEDDIVGAKTEREVIVSDFSELDAASMMKEFAKWRKSGAEDQPKVERKMGRPSAYQEKIMPHLAEIKDWKQKERLTDEAIAKRLGITARVLSKYKQQVEALKTALIPPIPTPEEAAQLQARAELNRQKSFNSFKSYIGNRATAEELVVLVEKIAENSSYEAFAKYRKILDTYEKEAEKWGKSSFNDLEKEELPF